MSLWNYWHHHYFFHNKELNNFYVAIGLMALAESLIGLFVPIYLYQLGYSIQAILGFYVLVSLFFALLAYSGARLIPFGGWEMAVEYSGIAKEHTAVRTAAGLFDVSHMGEFEVRGPEALQLIFGPRPF